LTGGFYCFLGADILDNRSIGQSWNVECHRRLPYI